MSAQLNHLSRRLIAGLLCLSALFAGMLSEGLHLALQEHHYCAEHDAIEHGEEVAADTLESEQEAASPAGPQLSSAPESSEHELCGLPPLSREDGFSFTAIDKQTEPWRPVLCLLTPFPFEPLSSIPRYRIAPKQSPPVG